jgi:hypothetical protein
MLKFLSCPLKEEPDQTKEPRRNFSSDNVNINESFFRTKIMQIMMEAIW